MLEKLEKTNILVTGGTGFIGRHLLEHLMKMPQSKITVVSRKSRPESWPSPHVWVQSSLQNLTPNSWVKNETEKFDYVFHLAAFTPKLHTLADNIEKNHNDNIQGTRALLESLPNSPKRFLFASSLDVYSPPAKGEILDETSALGPSTLYGASKLFCEYLLKAFRRENGLPFTILRYGHIYGPGEEAYEKFIPQNIRKLKLGQPLKVYGSGQTLRDYLYVKDAVYATLVLATAEGTQGEIFNVVRGVSLPIHKILETLKQVGNFKNLIEYDSTQLEGISLRFENKKLLNFLSDWKPIELEEGLKQELIQWQEK